MMRQRFFEDLDAVAAGGEPKAIVRDPEVNRCIELPIIGRRHFVEGTAPPRPRVSVPGGAAGRRPARL